MASIEAPFTFGDILGCHFQAAAHASSVTSGGIGQSEAMNTLTVVAAILFVVVVAVIAARARAEKKTEDQCSRHLAEVGEEIDLRDAAAWQKVRVDSPS